MLDHIELNNNNHFMGEKYLYVKRNNDIYRYKLINCKNKQIESKTFIYIFNDEFKIDYFCFPNKKLRDLFSDLMEVKSVGLKTARLIVSQFTFDEFENIVKNFEYDKLMVIKGLGVLSTKTIIETLQEKWFGVKYSTKQRQLIQMATRLGYSRSAVLKTIKRIDKKLDEEESIKYLLSELGKEVINNASTN